MSDLISRQAAIDAIMCEPTDAHYPSWYAERLEQLPSAQPEPLTDKEQRIFLAAMGREEKVCKYKDSLVKTCHEIIRKVKGALWT